MLEYTEIILTNWILEKLKKDGVLSPEVVNKAQKQLALKPMTKAA